MKQLFLFFSLFLCTKISLSKIAFAKTYGEPSTGEFGNCGMQTSGGSYILAGNPSATH